MPETPRDCQILALRLLLAYMSDTEDEAAFFAWAIQRELGLNRVRFEVAARTAREAASWWREAGKLEEGRQRMLNKLERMTASKATA